jgi:hypothetical protein
MQKPVEFRGAAPVVHQSGATGQATDAAATAAPSVERISALAESLSHTLECIKTLNDVIPAGQMRDKLEIERANLVKALAVAHETAMRARTGEAGAATAGNPIVSIVRRG